jgi:hypothetical protein
VTAAQKEEFLKDAQLPEVATEKKVDSGIDESIKALLMQLGQKEGDRNS